MLVRKNGVTFEDQDDSMELGQVLTAVDEETAVWQHQRLYLNPEVQTSSFTAVKNTSYIIQGPHGYSAAFSVVVTLPEITIEDEDGVSIELRGSDLPSDGVIYTSGRVVWPGVVTASLPDDDAQVTAFPYSDFHLILTANKGVTHNSEYCWVASGGSAPYGVAYAPEGTEPSFTLRPTASGVVVIDGDPPKHRVVTTAGLVENELTRLAEGHAGHSLMSDGSDYTWVQTQLDRQGASGSSLVAVNKTIYLANVSSIPCTITLPEIETDLDYHIVVKIVGPLTHSCTVDGNGATIDGNSTYSFSSSSQCVTFRNFGSDWIVTSS